MGVTFLKIISTMSLKPEQLEQIKAVRPDLEIEVKKQFTESDEKVEGLLTYGWDITEQTLDLYPNLKWIQAMAAGVDQLPLQAFAEKGILLTNVRGAHSIQMAEHVIWSILNLLRPAKAVIRQQEQKIFTGAEYTSPSGIFKCPSHFIAFSPLIENVRSVPGPTMRTLSVRSIKAFSGSIACDIF